VNTLTTDTQAETNPNMTIMKAFAHRSSAAALRTRSKGVIALEMMQVETSDSELLTDFTKMSKTSSDTRETEAADIGVLPVNMSSNSERNIERKNKERLITS